LTLALEGHTHRLVDIELHTHDPERYLALVELRSQGGTAGYAAWVTVRSRGFAARQLVGFHTAHLAAFVKAVAAMDRTLQGTARLQSDYEDHFLELSVGATGTVSVRGELHEHSGTPQLLRFEFDTDQTCLRTLAGDLQACLNDAEQAG
jgi:hypothetical protein